MDWKNLVADLRMILPVHFTKGRGGKRINKIVVHYNAGNLSVAGCYNVWLTRAASAHYQVTSDGTIGQLVWDADTAWHCGVFSQNQQSIGIEHANRSDGTISDACLEAGTHLVAAICVYYKLGRPEWLKNVFPHKYFSSTSCPGQIYGSQKDRYIQRAQYWYDVMTGTTTESGTQDSGKEYTGAGFNGAYKVNCDVLNVRTAPTTSAEVVAQYKRGQTVYLDDWYTIADDYVWGRYTGATSGQKRYVAVGHPTGGVAADDLLLKTQTTGVQYMVQAGDTLSGIAAKYNTTYQALANKNGISDPNKIYVGQVLKI